MPILQRLVSAYKLWHEYLPHFPKTSRYTVGEKIDTLFVKTIEALFTASYLKREEKLPWLKQGAVKLDLLKFFLQISWEIDSLEMKKYIALSKPLEEIGKMLGGWIRQNEIAFSQKPTPQTAGRK